MGVSDILYLYTFDKGDDNDTHSPFDVADTNCIFDNPPTPLSNPPVIGAMRSVPVVNV
jgi:hypothetical protein